MKTMKTAVMTGIRKMKFENRPIPILGSDEVLVKLEYVGICGSDIHYYESGKIGDFIVEPPFVLGHECAGTIVEVGQNVKHLAKGDRVALEPGKTCKICKYCREGDYHLCPDVIFFATPPVDGVFQEYVAHEAALCFKLPDNVSTLEGALIEPLAIGFHAANYGGAELGQTAVVFGAGCIGLVSMLALKAKAVTKVIVVDSLKKRLDKALELGADEVINFTEADVAAHINDIDLCIETSGAQSATATAIDICAKGATIVMVGYSSSDNISIPMNAAINKELTFKSIFRYRHIYPMAIEAVASGKVKLKALADYICDFDELPKAMEHVIEKKADIVKAVVRI
ncbi:MAG: NAD(P)-dependent alcohol dehydrogenase [Defluviitaleaceae bacterium]|nr:NAD(P)-dependent alcohol dehydrogenase [Defluviitaleaceae bacterium]